MKGPQQGALFEAPPLWSFLFLFSRTTSENKWETVKTQAQTSNDVRHLSSPSWPQHLHHLHPPLSRSLPSTFVHPPRTRGLGSLFPLVSSSRLHACRCTYSTPPVCLSPAYVGLLHLYVHRCWARDGQAPLPGRLLHFFPEVSPGARVNCLLIVDWNTFLLLLLKFCLSTPSPAHPSLSTAVSIPLLSFLSFFLLTR